MHFWTYWNLDQWCFLRGYFSLDVFMTSVNAIHFYFYGFDVTTGVTTLLTVAESYSLVWFLLKFSCMIFTSCGHGNIDFEVN